MEINIVVVKSHQGCSLWGVYLLLLHTTDFGRPACVVWSQGEGRRPECCIDHLAPPFCVHPWLQHGILPSETCIWILTWLYWENHQLCEIQPITDICLWNFMLKLWLMRLYQCHEPVKPTLKNSAWTSASSSAAFSFNYAHKKKMSPKLCFWMSQNIACVLILGVLLDTNLPVFKWNQLAFNS